MTTRWLPRILRAQRKQGSKIYLMNDTSRDRHAGCRAVMESIRNELKHCSIIKTHHVGEFCIDRAAMEEADWVLVNGEGTIHHNVPKAEFLMLGLKVAQDLGKRTALVNALYQQNVCVYRDVLAKLDYFTVRETCSASAARKHRGKPLIRLDSAADRKLSRTGTPIRGKSEVLFGSTHPEAPTHGLLRDVAPESFVDMHSGEFWDIVATLREAHVYVTGQHHGIYAAALARCPFVALEGNSHKISGLMSWSGFPIPVIADSVGSVADGLKWVEGNKSMFMEFFDWFEEQDVTRLENVL